MRNLFFTLLCLGCFLFSTISFAKGKRKMQMEGWINLNTATVEQLMLLPRVGRRTAQRILAYRQKKKFTRASQIMRVRGIGRKTYHRLSKWLTVEKPTQIKVTPL